MQPQLPVHQLIRSYWMDRGLRYRVLSPLQHQNPQEFRQWACPQLYLSPTPQEASDHPLSMGISVIQVSGFRARGLPEKGVRVMNINDSAMTFYLPYMFLFHLL